MLRRIRSDPIEQTAETELSNSEQSLSEQSDNDNDTDNSQINDNSDNEQLDNSDNDNDDNTRNEYSCSLCPNKTLLNQSAVNEHLQSKSHLKAVKQYEYNNRSPDEIAKLKKRNALKQQKYLQRKHPERFVEQQQIQAQFDALGNDTAAIEQLKQKIRNDRRKQAKLAKKAKNTSDKQPSADTQRTVDKNTSHKSTKKQRLDDTDSNKTSKSVNKKQKTTKVVNT